MLRLTIRGGQQSLNSVANSFSLQSRKLWQQFTTKVPITTRSSR